MILSHKSPNQSITSTISGDRQFILDLQNERGTTDSLRGIASEASCLHQQERKHSLRSEKWDSVTSVHITIPGQQC